MKKNEKCKVVQDLLPRYAENLTNSETNKYIEEHLVKCKECLKKLNDISDKSILDKVEEKRKGRILKKKKKRNRLILLIILIVIILILIFINYFLKHAPISVDDNGNPQYIEAFKIFISGENKLNVSNITNIVLEGPTIWDDHGEKKENYYTIILTFDENDICIGARYCIEGFSEEELMKRYNDFMEVENSNIKATSKVRINEGNLIFNYNYWTKKSKDVVLKEILEAFPEFKYTEM